MSEWGIKYTAAILRPSGTVIYVSDTVYVQAEDADEATDKWYEEVEDGLNTILEYDLEFFDPVL